MFLYLLLSSLAAGIIATAVMVFFLYLPLLWGGAYYDVLGALGSAITKEVNGRARFIGSLLYFGGGIFFAFFYGWAVLGFLTSNFVVPEFLVFPGFPVQINLFYPILGLVIGLAHGIFVALIVTIVVIEHHPLEHYHSSYTLIVSQVFSHIAFGVTVMFFQSQFLQLLLGG